MGKKDYLKDLLDRLKDHLIEEAKDFLIKELKDKGKDFIIKKVKGKIEDKGKSLGPMEQDTLETSLAILGEKFEKEDTKEDIREDFYG